MTTIGLDLGGSKVLAVRADGESLADRRFAPLAAAPSDLSKVAIEAVRSVWADDVQAIGVGIAGMVSWPSGVFVWGPHLAGTNVPIRADLESTFEVPVVVDNDANAALWGEARVGAVQGYRNALILTLGTGIGGGLLIDGSLYRGNSFAGEVGHMNHQRGVLQCDCGKQCCWETVASGPALVRLGKAAIEQNPDGTLAHRFGEVRLRGEDITGAADSGDAIAQGLVAQVGRELGFGLANLIAVLDPEIIVVGGGLGSVGESLLGPARRVVADAIHGFSHRMPPPILVAGLGPDAGAMGAAILAADVIAGRVHLDVQIP